MSSLESKVLARALGHIGGRASRLAALLLSEVGHEDTFSVALSRSVLTSFFGSLGQSVPELPSSPEEGRFSFLVGSGSMGLNPTLVQVAITGDGEPFKVSIRAVAKEGLIKQRSAQKAVDSIWALLTQVGA